MLGQERTRLAEAQLFFVTEEMTRLALVAAETLPVHNLHPEDIPAGTGFVVSFGHAALRFLGGGSPLDFRSTPWTSAEIAELWGGSAPRWSGILSGQSLGR